MTAEEMSKILAAIWGLNRPGDCPAEWTQKHEELKDKLFASGTRRKPKLVRD